MFEIKVVHVNKIYITCHLLAFFITKYQENFNKAQLGKQGLY
jgi:hypothetical protein